MAHTRTRKIKKSSDNILDKTKVTVTLQLTNSQIDDLQEVMDFKKCTLEKWLLECARQHTSNFRMAVNLSKNM